MDSDILNGLVVLVVLAAIVASTRNTPAQPASRAIVDDEGVRRTYGGKLEAVRWSELVEVGIVTSDAGPWSEDVHWLFLGANGEGCAIPGSEVDRRVFERLERLPGYDPMAVVSAMGSTSNASFRVWKGERGEGRAAAGPLPSA